ncbi:MAG TPA: DUF2278 family protein [Puia sp.]|nr:DUF2278 family protein [Puia sp.]
MPISDYGVLVGTATAKLDSDEAMKEVPKGSPHYMILIEAAGVKYRIAANVKSDTKPPDLQFYLDDNYKHPILDAVGKLAEGFNPIPNGGPNTAALDYIRGNLFDLKDLQILPATANGSNNDLNDIFNVWVEKALATTGTLVYAFGSKWAPEKAPDDYFDFTPGQGIHDIHMNQGNTGSFAKDNGVYTDGGLFIHFPDEDRWIAMFLKFQSQVVHTSDGDAEPIVTPVLPEDDTDVRIFAALINPASDDTGHEAVYLLNTTDKDISLEGWSIADNTKKKEMLSGTIAAGEALRHQLNGKTAQLSNGGGIITLLNKDGLKISGVSYTKDQAGQQGKVIVF